MKLPFNSTLPPLSNTFCPSNTAESKSKSPALKVPLRKMFSAFTLKNLLAAASELMVTDAAFISMDSPLAIWPVTLRSSASITIPPKRVVRLASTVKSEVLITKAWPPNSRVSIDIEPIADNDPAIVEAAVVLITIVDAVRPLHDACFSLHN